MPYDKKINNFARVKYIDKMAMFRGISYEMKIVNEGVLPVTDKSYDETVRILWDRIRDSSVILTDYDGCVDENDGVYIPIVRDENDAIMDVLSLLEETSYSFLSGLCGLPQVYISVGGEDDERNQIVSPYEKKHGRLTIYDITTGRYMPMPFPEGITEMSETQVDDYTADLLIKRDEDKRIREAFANAFEHAKPYVPAKDSADDLDVATSVCYGVIERFVQHVLPDFPSMTLADICHEVDFVQDVISDGYDRIGRNE